VSVKFLNGYRRSMIEKSMVLAAEARTGIGGDLSIYIS
jgi:hypothetical protein